LLIKKGKEGRRKEKRIKIFIQLSCMSLFLKENSSEGAPKGADFDVRAKDWRGKQVKEIL
jgi:hypothetical protein